MEITSCLPSSIIEKLNHGGDESNNTNATNVVDEYNETNDAEEDNGVDETNGLDGADETDDSKDAKYEYVETKVYWNDDEYISW